MIDHAALGNYIAWGIPACHLNTGTGAPILNALAFDATVTDHGIWREACDELDEASALPWVLLSGGVDETTFEAQVSTACDAGASGVLVGRSVWADADAVTTRPSQRLLMTVVSFRAPDPGDW